ncbi:Pex28p [Sugiyamaella lignohabitans]|uniref:Pex28p n=1 Tax=Sugiyamaella lignohabitans TaxID=796027 RepID=A0A167FSI3_9ASCO|nr:Pex28p [Sugiyamaella lignohabitans]ANB15646.1 Pex28p [Sugiyamaella lignohabitans]
MVPGFDHRHPFPDYLLPQISPRVSEFNVVDSPEDILAMRREQHTALAKTKAKHKRSGSSIETARSLATKADTTRSSDLGRSGLPNAENTSLNGITNELAQSKPLEKDDNDAEEQEAKDMLKSVRQLQALLNDIANLLDVIEELFYGIGSFAGDERTSTAVYLLLLIGIFILPVGASLIPVNFSVAVMGWAAVGLLHPVVGKEVKRIKVEYLDVEELILGDLFRDFEAKEIIIENHGPEDTREVEIFELQRQGLTPRLWDAWVFTPLIYSEKSIYRISEERPPGCAFIESVLPPPGWYFDDQHPWILDEMTKAWVLDRSVLNVEIDLDEHWAYDYRGGQRGEWRRRRWTRTCFRGPMPPRKR